LDIPLDKTAGLLPVGKKAAIVQIEEQGPKVFAGLFSIEKIWAGAGVGNVGPFEPELHGVATGPLDEGQYSTGIPRVDLRHPHLAPVIVVQASLSYHLAEIRGEAFDERMIHGLERIYPSGDDWATCRERQKPEIYNVDNQLETEYIYSGWITRSSIRDLWVRETGY
jgi:hypothetical protein